MKVCFSKEIPCFVALIMICMPNSSASDDVCGVLDRAEVISSNRNTIYDKLKSYVQIVVGGERIRLTYRVRPSRGLSCEMRVYGGRVVDELKGQRKPVKEHFDVVSRDPVFSSLLVSSVLDEMPRRSGFLAFGEMLSGLFAKEVVDAVFENQVKKYVSTGKEKKAFEGTAIMAGVQGLTSVGTGIADYRAGKREAKKHYF